MIDELVEKIKSLSRAKTPLLIALDGRSGTGKSTIATTIAEKVGGVVIEGDDFYAGGTEEEWDARTSEEKASLCIDWKRLRKEALEPLLANHSASWHPFDWKAGKGLAEHIVTRNPTPVIVLDGVYSSRPELTDLIDLTVLVEVQDGKRRERLIGREGFSNMKDWHQRWDEAEEYYFTKVRPPSSFSFVITNH